MSNTLTSDIKKYKDALDYVEMECDMLLTFIVQILACSLMIAALKFSFATDNARNFWKLMTVGRGPRLTNWASYGVFSIILLGVEYGAADIETWSHADHGFSYYVSMIIALLVASEIFFSKICRRLDYLPARVLSFMVVLFISLMIPSHIDNKDNESLNAQASSHSVPNNRAENDRITPVRHVAINNIPLYENDIVTKMPDNFVGDNSPILMGLPVVGMTSEAHAGVSINIGSFDSFAMTVKKIEPNGVIVMSVRGYGGMESSQYIDVLITPEQVSTILKHGGSITPRHTPSSVTVNVNTQQVTTEEYEAPHSIAKGITMGIVQGVASGVAQSTADHEHVIARSSSGEKSWEMDGPKDIVEQGLKRLTESGVLNGGTIQKETTSHEQR